MNQPKIFDSVPMTNSRPVGLKRRCGEGSCYHDHLLVYPESIECTDCGKAWKAFIESAEIACGRKEHGSI